MVAIRPGGTWLAAYTQASRAIACGTTTPWLAGSPGQPEVLAKLPITAGLAG